VPQVGRKEGEKRGRLNSDGSQFIGQSRRKKRRRTTPPRAPPRQGKETSRECDATNMYFPKNKKEIERRSEGSILPRRGGGKELDRNQSDGKRRPIKDLPLNHWESKAEKKVPVPTKERDLPSMGPNWLRRRTWQKKRKKTWCISTYSVKKKKKGGPRDAALANGRTFALKKGSVSFSGGGGSKAENAKSKKALLFHHG